MLFGRKPSEKKAPVFDISSPNPLSNLDEKTRLKLATVLELRNEYYEKLTQLNKMKIMFLRDPNSISEESITDFSSAVIAPLRSRMAQESGTLLEAAFDVDHMKSMVPMILMAVLQGVNIPLALSALGTDPDQIQELVSKAKDFISNGFDRS